MATIRNPIEWIGSSLRLAGSTVADAAHAVVGDEASRSAALPAIRRIRVADLRDALESGVDDFGAFRTDVLFIVIVYPLAGLLLARLILDENALPMLFPVAAGFALIGPVAAVGLYEMSRRRERGEAVSWATAFGVIRAPGFGAIVALGLVLLGIFGVWMLAALVIYDATLGPNPPASMSAFAHDVLTTGPGWTMIVVGIGVGFLFAALTLVISVVSFPMIIDRGVPLRVAVATSVRAVRANPRTMATWGLFVAGGLVLGSLPIFLGLIFVLPILGHATWHLYRKLVAFP
ncbi:MAG: DUF2189 domain-containing protein [Alphaproteobacteria bacterium]|nr:DUF2189 domain-containing protein [Alphaproteobacteria bacterium]